jgi:hypothetical protein
MITADKEKIGMKEISVYGSFVKVRPSMHLLENKGEEVSNGHKGVTLSMVIFSLSVLLLLSMAEPSSR